MACVDTALVSIGLPVRNAVDRVEDVVKSVLTQDHENLELIVSDNASTDGTEEVCRNLARCDARIVYHRHPVNIGLLNNFIGVMRLASGTYFRWIGDDDWLAPHCVSRCLDEFASDDRLILVTSQVAYRGPDDTIRTPTYEGNALGSDDPVRRFAEMLRLLNERDLLIDPLYGMFRRERILSIDRRNMLREDEVFATKLALAGPWGHVPEVLSGRDWKSERLSSLAHTLDVPAWQAHLATTLQCREMLLWLNACSLDPHQRRRARLEVARMYALRQRNVAIHRGRKLARTVGELVHGRRHS